MKVSHVITRLIVGGAQENTLATVLGLREKFGLEVELLAGPTHGPEGSLVDRARAVEGVYREVPDLIRPIHPLRDYSACRFLKKHFLETRPDIVHTHSGKAGFIGRMAAADAGVPLIIHSIHGPSFGPFQSWLKNVLYIRAEKMAASRTHHFITVADAMTRTYLDAGIASPEKYTRIFSGFPLGEYEKAENDDQLRRKLGIQNNDFVVGKIGRLFRLKGHEDLFRIAPALVDAIPEIKFLLIGGGEWEGRFRRMAAKMGLSDNFIFTGLVPPESIPSLVGIMDLLVHLSLREGLPRALPQAQAAGKPVIAYDCDGAGEVCRDGRSGYLVPPGDLESLKELIIRLYESPDLAFKFGSQGRDFVLENFSVDRLVEEQYRLYNDLMHQSVPNYVI
jgi:glycosyltransferase involved in cell wall biosynthesis